MRMVYVRAFFNTGKSPRDAGFCQRASCGRKALKQAQGDGRSGGFVVLSGGAIAIG